MERGVIISPHFTFDGRKLHFSGSTAIESEYLKHFLLYWDKIEFPTNNLIHTSSPDIEYLINVGVLQRTKVNFTGSGIIEEAYVTSQAIVSQHLNKTEPGKWTIAQSSNQLFLPKDCSNQVQSLEIELYNALPTPGNNVSFDDILIFKENYKSELIAFRTYLDELYLDISQTGDIPRAKNVAISKIERAIQDLDNAATANWESKLSSSIKVEFNLPSIIENAVKGAGIAALTGLPISICAAVGSIAGLIKMEVSTSPKVNGVPEELKDFAYICHVRKVL